MARMMTTPDLLTAADILRDNAYERGELWDGHFVVCEPSGGPHGVIEALGVARMLQIPALKSAGWVFGSSAGYLVARDPDRVLSPDVSWIARDHLPAIPEAGFIEGAPDLAIEIRSPKDSWATCLAKGGVWIGHGAQIACCVNPPQRSVAVLRPGRDPEELDATGAIHLAPIADAEIPVADLFAGL